MYVYYAYSIVHTVYFLLYSNISQYKVGVWRVLGYGYSLVKEPVPKSGTEYLLVSFN